MSRRLLPWLVAFTALAVVGAFVLKRTFVPDPRGATVTHFTLESKLLDRSLGETLVLPPAARRPKGLVVLLHGRSSSAGQYVGKQEFFDTLAELGPSAPAVLIVNGGDHSYYHDREEGPWGRYVVEEAIPEGLERSGATRLAIGGISMGGFGAFDLALKHPGLFCAVGGHSAALWLSGGQTPEGVFDDAEDFARNDVFAMVKSRRRPLGPATAWLDVGTSDPFYVADTAFAAALRRSGQPTQFETSPGGHDGGYWGRHMRSYLRFYAQELERCAARS